eukprot:795959-Alexandrium_andersonii.AAC.1
MAKREAGRPLPLPRAVAMRKAGLLHQLAARRCGAGALEDVLMAVAAFHPPRLHANDFGEEAEEL